MRGEGYISGGRWSGGIVRSSLGIVRDRRKNWGWGSRRGVREREWYASVLSGVECLTQSRIGYCWKYSEI